MNENFLTSQKATNALSKMRSKACTLEELELTKEEIEELISATGNINYNDTDKTYYITKFKEKNYLKRQGISQKGKWVILTKRD